MAETSYGFTLEEKEGCSLVFSKELAEKGGYEPAPEGQAQFLKDLIACIDGDFFTGNPHGFREEIQHGLL